MKNRSGKYGALRSLNCANCGCGNCNSCSGSCGSCANCTSNGCNSCSNSSSGSSCGCHSCHCGGNCGSCGGNTASGCSNCGCTRRNAAHDAPCPTNCAGECVYYSGPCGTVKCPCGGSGCGHENCGCNQCSGCQNCSCGCQNSADGGCSCPGAQYGASQINTCGANAVNYGECNGCGHCASAGCSAAYAENFGDSNRNYCPETARGASCSVSGVSCTGSGAYSATHDCDKPACTAAQTGHHHGCDSYACASAASSCGASPTLYGAVETARRMGVYNDNNSSQNHGCARQTDNCCHGVQHANCAAEFAVSIGGCECGGMKYAVISGGAGFDVCHGGVRIENCGTYNVRYSFDGHICANGARVMTLNGAEISGSRSCGGDMCGSAVFTARAGDVIGVYGEGMQINGGGNIAVLTIVKAG